MWLAGAGVKGGQAIGATDELGFNAVENRCHVSDLHATILHLMGLDHTRLTYFYQGFDHRLTGVRGQVVEGGAGVSQKTFPGFGESWKRVRDGEAGVMKSWACVIGAILPVSLASPRPPHPIPLPKRGEGDPLSPSRRKASMPPAFRPKHLAPSGRGRPKAG